MGGVRHPGHPLRNVACLPLWGNQLTHLEHHPSGRCIITVVLNDDGLVVPSHPAASPFQHACSALLLASIGCSNAYHEE